ncbi:L,D-transpeptidase [Gordonia sp. CPCC 205333]|uniref:L,D-transpeptidase n=1 Tax=Gordonia sp. CPCC 205333 TaxID=3140790 RepID=UPI003AF3DE3D
MLTNKRSGRTRLFTRLLTTIVGVLAVMASLPALASAAPVTIIPGLPPIEIPGAPTTPKPKPKPKAPKTTTPEKPASPAIPNVKTSTGWIALAQDSTHQITWWHNGEVVKTMPISMGTNDHPTPNGVYYTDEKYRDMYMDSSTYGVPIDSAEGYRTYVEYATRMSSDGIFIHAAPWSVAQQGKSNASHGCINISTANGKWVFDTIPRNTPIVVRGTVGGKYDGN